MEFTFRVLGRPAPQGSKDGNGQESSIYLAPWRLAVKTAALRTLHDSYGRPALPVYPAPVPVHVTRCWFFVPWQVTAAPDIDKLLRSTLDAISGGSASGARVMADDSQVVAIDDLRIYSSTAAQPSGALLTLRIAGEDY